MIIKICDITEDGEYKCDIGGNSILDVKNGEKRWGKIIGFMDGGVPHYKYTDYEWPYPWKDTRQVEKVVPLGFYGGGFGSSVKIGEYSTPVTSQISFTWQVPKLYCPWMEVGEYTNISEDSNGGIMRIVTHNPLDNWAYSTDIWLKKHRSKEEYEVLKRAKEEYDRTTRK